MKKKTTAPKKTAPRKTRALAPDKVRQHAPSHAAFHATPSRSRTRGGGALLHQVMASSFADPADIAAFRKCKAQGNSDEFCFKLGDNGIGFMGDDCTTSTPMCALPVEDWMERWGSKQNARLKPVVVTANGKTVVCLLGDTMPRRANIKNGAGIDLSPAAVAAIGKKPPLMIAATWSWQDDE